MSTSKAVTKSDYFMLVILEEVKRWNTNELIRFLSEQNLKLIKEDFEIFKNERITGRAFLSLTEEKLRNVGFAMGPAIMIADLVKHLKAQETLKIQETLEAQETLKTQETLEAQET